MGDSRSKKWKGLGQVELDAVEPKKLQRMCEDAVSSVFDEALFDELKAEQEEEKEEYVVNLKKYIETL